MTILTQCDRVVAPNGSPLYREIGRIIAAGIHMLRETWIFGVVCILLAAMSPSAQGKEASCSAFAGTWYGAFRVLTDDGRSTRDNAVIVLSGDCSNVTGSAGSSIDRQTPISAVQLVGDEIRFHMEAMGGLDFRLKRRESHLVGTASGKIHAVIDVQPAPGLLPHGELVAEITEADGKLFEAFDTCNVAAYASHLSSELEFYHDRGGKTGYQEQLDSLQQRCDGGLVLRRELDEESLVVNASPGFGAIEAGIQRFYARQPDGSEHLDATARFTEVWTKASGSWKLVRVISYDHR